jgi:hypothetical protein
MTRLMCRVSVVAYVVNPDTLSSTNPEPRPTSENTFAGAGFLALSFGVPLSVRAPRVRTDAPVGPGLPTTPRWCR